MSFYAEWNEKDKNGKRNFLSFPKQLLRYSQEELSTKEKRKLIFDEIFPRLFDYDFIEIATSTEGKELGGGVIHLLTDYRDTLDEFYEYDELREELDALELLYEALNEIKDTIEDDNIELRQKLYGHLQTGGNEYIQLFSDQLSNTKASWLKPILPVTAEVGHKGAITYTTVTKKDIVVTYSGDGLLKQWDIHRGSETKSLPLEAPAHKLLVTETGKCIVRGYKNGELEVVDAETGNLIVKRTTLLRAEITFIEISPDFSWLVTYDSANTLLLTNLEKRNQIKSIYIAEPIRSLTFSADSKKLIAGISNRSIKVWDLERWGVVDTVTARLEGNAPVTSLVAIEGTTQIVAASSSSSTINVIDIDSGKILHTLNNNSGNVTSLVDCKNNLLSLLADGTLKLWDLTSRRVIAQWKGSSSITSCAVAKDGRSFAFGENSGKMTFLALQNYPAASREDAPYFAKPNILRSEAAVFRSALGKDEAVRPAPKRRSPKASQPLQGLIRKINSANWQRILSSNALKSLMIGGGILAIGVLFAVYRPQGQTGAEAGQKEAKLPAPKSSPLPSPSPSLALPSSPPPQAAKPLPSPSSSPRAVDPLNNKPQSPYPSASKSTAYNQCISDFYSRTGSFSDYESLNRAYKSCDKFLLNQNDSDSSSYSRDFRADSSPPKETFVQCMRRLSQNRDSSDPTAADKDINYCRLNSI